MIDKLITQQIDDRINHKSNANGGIAFFMYGHAANLGGWGI